MHRLWLALPFAILALAQEPAPTPITPGTPIERELEASAVHAYSFPVNAGDFVLLSATQTGADVILRLYPATNQPHLSVDRLPYGGTEELPWIAPTAATIRVEVRHRQRSRTGPYRLQVLTRPATPNDRLHLVAFQTVWTTAAALLRTGKRASLLEARTQFERAAADFQAIGNTPWEAFALSQSSEASMYLSDHTAARASGEKALALRRTLDERYSLSVTLSNLGRTLSNLGENERALALYDEVLQIRRSERDLTGLAVSLTHVGLVHKRTSNFDRAIAVLTEALALRRTLGDPYSTSVSLSGLADIHYQMGNYQQALELYQETWEIRSHLKEVPTPGNAPHNLGNVYFALGNLDQAEQYWKLAEAEYRRQGDTPAISSIAYSRGRARALAGDHAAAAALYEQSLELEKKASYALATINSSTALCTELEALGQYPRGESLALEALSLSRKSNSPSSIASSLECLGRIELATNRLPQARTHLTEALTISRETRARESTSRIAQSLAELERKSGQIEVSLNLMDEVHSISESVRAQVSNPDLRALYAAANSQRLEFHTSLLMEAHRKQPSQGFDQRAFHLSEQARARSLTEMIQDSRENLRLELTAAQRTTEDQLTNSLRTLQRRLFRDPLTPAAEKELKLTLASTERELDLFQSTLRRSGSRYAAAQSASIPDARRIQSELLAPSDVLIEFSLGAKESWAWALTRDGLWSISLPPRKDLQSRIDAYRKLLTERTSALTLTSALQRIDSSGADLYKTLLAPLEPALKGKTRLLLVPDGGLAYLPFETLPAGQRLIERFQISYLPSASAWFALRERERDRPQPQRTLLAFADPSLTKGPALAAAEERGFAFTSLPFSRTEVSSISKLFQPAASRVLSGAQASEAALQQEPVSSYRFLHFAAHGYFDEEKPARSGIVLSRDDAANDGILQSPEIMRLRLNADLVTLSACQSGLGKVLSGEGVLGLSRAFFYAGAQSLVVSLWNVNDAATAELMRHFYTNLKSGLPRDQALRQAKLSLLKSPAAPTWRHPYFWAPFILLGQ